MHFLIRVEFPSGTAGMAGMDGWDGWSCLVSDWSIWKWKPGSEVTSLLSLPLYFSIPTRNGALRTEGRINWINRIIITIIHCCWRTVLRLIVTQIEPSSMAILEHFIETFLLFIILPTAIKSYVSFKKNGILLGPLPPCLRMGYDSLGSDSWGYYSPTGGSKVVESIRLAGMILFNLSLWDLNFFLLQEK